MTFWNEHKLFLFCAMFAQVVHCNVEVGNSSQDVICFLFASLLAGAIVTYILSRASTDVPFTVVVFGFGVLISTIKEFTQTSMEDSISMWDNINPHLIMYIFLPALLFGEAMSLNFHRFSGALSSSILLAGPGALFCAFVIALGAKYILSYEWSWSMCLILGAILCTTDAVGEFLLTFILCCIILMMYVLNYSNCIPFEESWCLISIE